MHSQLCLRRNTFGTGTTCKFLSCRESTKRSKERYGPTLGVCLILLQCPSYRDSNKRSKERYGPTLGVCFTEMSVL